LSSDFLVVVEGQVGDVGGLKFIVDTGTARSVIDRNVVAKLHLRRHTGKIMNFDRFVPTEYADVPTFQIGPLRAQGLRVMVANLLEYSEFAKGVDGIVGVDLLSRSRKLGIDYEKKRLYFELTPNEISGPVPRCFVVPVVVQGTTMRLVVDTGLAEILLYSNRLQKYGSRIRTEGEPETVRMGRIHGRKVALPGVQLGGPDETITAVLIDKPAEPAMLALDGYLGVASLHASRVDFDFGKMTLRWQSSPGLGKKGDRTR
jgi:predicted aspartyl protease